MPSREQRIKAVTGMLWMRSAAKQRRFQAIGRLADGTISVVFAVLGSEGISVISMRPANAKERSLLP